MNLFPRTCKPQTSGRLGLNLALLALVLALLSWTFSPLVAATGPAWQKEEVVYAVLQPDASYDRLIVINQFKLTEAADLEDYGAYDGVQALDDKLDLNFDLDQGLVSFRGEAGYNYYRGELPERELPWLLNFSYQLDGQAKDPADLAGAQGEFSFSLEISNNPKVDQALREGFILQLSVQLDKANYRELSSNAAMQVGMGNQTMLNWLLLPQEDQPARAEFSCQVEDFAMLAPKLVAIPLQLSEDQLPEDLLDVESLLSAAPEGNPFKKLAEGVDSLQAGAQDLQAGSGQIGEALEQMQAGGEELSSAENQGKLQAGLQDLQAGAQDLNAGLQQYSEGVEQLALNYPQLSQGLGDLTAGLQTLGEKAPDLESGMADLASGLDQIVAGLAQQFAEVPLESPDPALDINEAIQTLDGMAASLTAVRPLLELDLAPFQNSLAALASLDLPSEAELKTLQTILAEAGKGQANSEAAGQLQQVVTDLTTYVPYLQDAQIRANYQLTLQELQGAMLAMAEESQALLTNLAKLSTALTSLQDLQAMDFTGLQQSLSQLQTLQSSYGPQLAGMDEQLAQQRQALVDLAQTMDQAGLGQLNELYQGLQELQTGYQALQEGMQAYLGGIREMADRMPDLQAGVEEFGAGLQEIAEAGSQLREGSQTFTEGLAAYEEGLDKYYAGVGSLSQGLSQLAEEYPAFDEGLGQLSGGLTELQSGLADFQSELDPHLQNLVKDMLPKYEPQSFVSPDNEVTSVQFIIVLPAVAEAKAESLDFAEETDSRAFLEKFTDLFS